MNRLVRSFPCLVLLGVLLGTPVAYSQDALRGKSLYVNTNGAPISCADGNCHGPDPTKNQGNVLKGANNAPVIEAAIATKVQEMKFLSAYVSSQDALDIAAYLANPAVAPAPRIAVTPTTITFASTYVGNASAIAAVTVSNTGTANLVLSSVSIAGTNAAEFRLESTSTCTSGLTLVPGATCRTDLSFRPATTGAKSSSLTIAHNAAGSIATVPLSGTATLPPMPAITLSPAAITFPSTTAGGVSAIYSVTAANTGTATLNFSAISVTGANANDFRIEPTSTCSTTAGVAAGASCRVDLTFRPTVVGPEAASLVLAHNASSGSSTIALSGTGTTAPAPTIGISANSLSFGPQEVATQSPSQSITLTNVGNAVLNIGSLVSGGSHPAEFPRSGSCAAGLALPAAGGNCTLVFTFAPAAIGDRSSNLTIASNNAGGDVTISLAGTATTNIPAASISPAALSFGSQQIGTVSTAQTAAVSNTGGGILTINAVAISGMHFNQSGNCIGANLAARQSCTVSVAFAPTASGPLAASLTVTHTAVGSPLSVALSGNGTTAPVPLVQAVPATVTFPGVTAVGQPTPPQRVIISNAGPGSLTLGAIASNSIEFVLAGGAPGNCTASMVVSQGGSCFIDVSFAPATPGAKSGLVSIASDGTPAVLTVPVAGDASGVAAPAISSDRATLSFGSVAVGAQSQAQPLWLTNTGSANLNVTAMGTAPPFVLTSGGTCSVPPFALIPGQSCLLQLGFAPTASGPQTGNLSLTSNAGSLTVGLAGSGIATPSGNPGVSSGGTPSNAGGGGALDLAVLLLLGAAVSALRRRRAGPRSPAVPRDPPRSEPARA